MTLRPFTDQASRRAIARWLFVCAGMVFAIVVIGGITRLTESGLSMVDWRPVTGWLPPLSQTEWERIFADYRNSPQYRIVNEGMTLAQFKSIFWWEYIHRLWGRLTGLVFFVPFLWFLLRGRIGRDLLPRLLAMFVLGGLQGLLGWYMVKSGLVDRPEVSQYRLAAHLGLAVAIYGLILWTALNLIERNPGGRRDGGLLATTYGLIALAFLTILSGAFVAGLDAGLAYNTFPLMGDGLAPALYWELEPPLRNLFENVAAVQFNHRLLAVTTVVMAWAVAVLVIRRGVAEARVGAVALLLVASIQGALGIATLLLFVPISLAAAHQAGALLLFSVLLWLGVRLARGARPQKA